jgi:leucyl aminopeptidase
VIGYCKKYFQDQWGQNPEVIMTFATLTGSMVECLSDTYCGIFTNNDNIGKNLVDLGEKTGHLTWMMPCNEYYNYVWDNPYADIGNIHSRRGGGAIKGAKFIEFFIGKDIPFVHFDLAGVADCVERLNSNNCPTGYGIKLINEFIHQYN